MTKNVTEIDKKSKKMFLFKFNEKFESENPSRKRALVVQKAFVK